MATHDVTNQSRPLVDYDVFGADPALTEALQREGAGWAAVAALGRNIAELKRPNDLTR